MINLKNVLIIFCIIVSLHYYFITIIRHQYFKIYVELMYN